MWHFHSSLSIPWYTQIKVQAALPQETLRNRMLTPAAQCVQVLTSGLHLTPSCSLLAQPSKWQRYVPVPCHAPPHLDTALIPFSFIYYLFLSHLNRLHEPWKSHQFHCPYLRSISSHHQGSCNSLVSHHKCVTGNRKFGTATEQSSSIIFFIFQGWSGQLLLGRCSQGLLCLSRQASFHGTGFIQALLWATRACYISQQKTCQFIIWKSVTHSKIRFLEIDLQIILRQMLPTLARQSQA